MSDPNPTLQQAYQLIEDGELAEARALLAPIVESGNASPDVLWVYLHAVEDPETGKRIAAELAQKDPQYPGLEDITSEAGVGGMAVETATRSTDAAVDGIDDEFGDLEDVDETEESRRIPFMVILLSVLIVILVILVLVNPFAQQEPPADQTRVADVPTDDAGVIVDVTEDSEIVATVTTEAEITEEPLTVTSDAQDDASPTEVPSESETEEATAETDEPTAGSDPLVAQFSDFDLAQTPTVQTETELGDTLVVRICGFPGPVAGAHITNALIVFASINDEIEADAVGVSIVNCDTDTPFREIGVSKDDLTALASGEISEDELGSRIRPIDSR